MTRETTVPKRSFWIFKVLTPVSSSPSSEMDLYLDFFIILTPSDRFRLFFYPISRFFFVRKNLVWREAFTNPPHYLSRDKKYQRNPF